MSLLTPYFLWALLALIPLGLVYLMKTKPRKRVTNALFLWQKILDEKSSNFAIKKLRNLLSLLLMVILFVMVVLSLTNPYWGDKKDQKDLIVIIDSSVSMRAMSGTSSRFELAKSQVIEWLKPIEGGTRMALATADSGLHYHSSLTSNTRLLMRSLKDLQPSYVPLSSEAFSELTMLQGGTSEDTRCRIVFLTDGSSDVGSFPDNIEIIPVEYDVEPNFGITAADISLLPNSRAKIFFTVSSSAEEETSLEVELTHVASSRIAKLITITVPPNSEYSEFIEIDDVEAGFWSLDLRKSDIFLEDNKVVMGLNIPEPIGVAINVERPYFFQRCIEAFSLSENLLEVLPLAEASVSISEGEAIGSQSIVFAPRGNSPHWENVGAEMEQVFPTEIIKNHPLTKHLNIENISFSGAVKLEAPEGALILLKDISETPLLYESIQDGEKVIVANFQPAHDNFYFSPWFPIIIHNAARYLTGRREEMPAVNRSGSSIMVPTQQSEVRQSYHHFDGSEPVSLNVGNTHKINNLGGYSYTVDEQKWYTGASILSAGESSSQIAKSTVSLKAYPSSGWPLAWWLLLGAVLIALIEETLYHRRKVG